MSVMRLPYQIVVAKSDLIVLAEVNSIRRVPGGESHAHAKVIEVWKGEATDEIAFLASPTWTCDISAARLGEVAVLFLMRQASGPLHIAHSGRGRMPVRTIGMKRYATLWDDVILPLATTMVDGPEPEFSFIRSVELREFKKLVLNARYDPLTKEFDKKHGTA